MNAHRAIRVTAFIVGLIIFTAAAIMIRTSPALADGGGVPTNTPTVTLTPTWTATATTAPTTSLLQVGPTANATLVVIPLTNGEARVDVLAPTPIPIGSTEPSFSLLTCWPLALLVIALLVAGIWWMRNRLAGAAADSYGG